MSRASILDEIAGAFAEAAASGEFEEAEGWFSAAHLTVAREPGLVAGLIDPKARLT